MNWSSMRLIAIAAALIATAAGVAFATTRRRAARGRLGSRLSPPCGPRDGGELPSCAARPSTGRQALEGRDRSPAPFP